ncbi:hypothetical protein AQUCO_02600153v1 [Aquilegia coerulea]|uniref:Purine permease n=1 Tax=Aquilegia coerulea TaxID=218851 RepID=A0A2G5D7N8_AQUCA|nr:hypothetical protein AQUCO_02600153v1 [Aquilegia coerulea]
MSNNNNNNMSIEKSNKPANKKYWVLLIITYIALFVGAISSSLLAKFYFIHGGSSKWVSTWVQSAGSILIALGSSNDRPKGTSHTQYFIGFFSILGAGLIFALYLPLAEIVYKKVHSYEMVMEMQLVSQFAAQVIAIIGMAADGGFGEMATEAKVKFDRGRTAYWITIGFTLFAWQLSFMGTAGLVYLTKSLTGGVCMTALLPICVLGGVIAFGDKFGGNKAISTLLCFWGFCSYVYGEYKKTKIEKEDMKGEQEMNNIKERGQGEHNICDAA